jgi:beta-1,4-mannosyl-glycoprotein beta-1,4-N-acetylglucosaminyltransferase
MKIFDCFTFSHELDLLEIRLNSLNDVVDVFVLTESEQTFTGLDKELIFNKNKDRFSKFLHKIRHVIAPKVEGLPSIKDYQRNTPCHSCWQREFFQMNYFFNFIQDAASDDILLINPLDEIPRSNIIEKYKNEITTPRCLIYDLYFYKLNLMAVNNQKTQDLLKSNAGHKDSRGSLDDSLGASYPWYGSVIGQNKYINRNFWPTVHHQRNRMDLIENAGWHYTYVSSEEDILRKIKSFSHADYFRDENVDNLETIKNAIQNNTEIISADRELKKIELNELDAPQYVLDNIEKYKHLIK